MKKIINFFKNIKKTNIPEYDLAFEFEDNSEFEDDEDSEFEFEDDDTFESETDTKLKSADDKIPYPFSFILDYSHGFPDSYKRARANTNSTEDRIKEFMNLRSESWWYWLEELIHDFELTFRVLEVEEAEAAKQGEALPNAEKFYKQLSDAYHFLLSIEERLLFATGRYDEYFSQMATDKIDLQLEIGQCELIIKALDFYVQNEPEIRNLFSENFELFGSKRAFINEIKNSIKVKVCEKQPRTKDLSRAIALTKSEKLEDYFY